MKTTEIRVRPVVRHSVTRYTREVHGTSHEVVGEFDNEQYAQQVAEAMSQQSAPRVYVIVEDTLGVIDARVYYATDDQEARERQALCEMETGKTFRIYSRLVDRPF